MRAPDVLALWNGAQSEARAEYEAWHGIEHMPERLGAPGFLAARRYRQEGGDGYFTLYELEALSALESPAYAALMQQPTAWSTRMRQVMTGFRRLPCTPLFHRRQGLGGALATLRLEQGAEEVLPLLQPLLERQLRDGGLLGAVLGAGQGAGQPYPVFPDAPVPGVECLLLLEGTEPELIAAIAADCAGLVQAGDMVQHWRLLQALRREELPDPGLPRQPPRDDLCRRWADQPPISAR